MTYLVIYGFHVNQSVEMLLKCLPFAQVHSTQSIGQLDSPNVWKVNTVMLFSVTLDYWVPHELDWHGLKFRIMQHFGGKKIELSNTAATGFTGDVFAGVNHYWKFHDRLIV